MAIYNSGLRSISQAENRYARAKQDMKELRSAYPDIDAPQKRLSQQIKDLGQKVSRKFQKK